MRLYSKIFLIIVIPLSLVLLISFKFIDEIIEKNLKNEFLNEMRSKWVLLSHYKINDKFNLKTYNILRDISKRTHLRITVIKTNGVVVYDSFLTPEGILKMENHKHRPEVVKALRGKNYEGYSIRFSHTLKMEMFYYAKMLNNNLILRIAYPLTYIQVFRKIFLNQVEKTYFFLFLISILISLIIALSISIPVRKLEKLADDIETGEKYIEFPSFSDHTLNKVAKIIYKIYSSMLNKQSQIIEEKEKQESIFSILEEGIILVSKDYRIVYFNKKAEKYLKIKLEKGKNIFSIGSIDCNVINFLRSIEKKTGSYREKLYGKLFEIYIKEFEDEKLFVFYDISKQFEYTEFKYQLIGNISHELKTPIATIMNYAETILNYKDLDRETLLNFLNIIYKNASRINEVIHDILELHKLENLKKIELDEEITLNEQIEEIMTRFKDVSKKIHFNCKIEKLKMHPHHFQSLITNLIDNACKYSSGNNVYVDISKKEDKIVFEVKDEGPSIPMEERDRIFERFYTVSKSRNIEKSGSGLGLSIVKHIAKIYNGNVGLYTNEFGGNTFWVEMEI